jgi:hypothetical protein
VTIALNSIVQRILDEGVATPGEIRGCSDVEIERVRQDQGLDRLPQRYQEFLRTMGAGAGRLLIGTDAYYPGVLGIKADARELLAECEQPDLLPTDAVVFAMHQGYQVYWLAPAGGDDPVVYVYQEGDSGPSRTWPSFTVFLADAVSEARAG